MRALLLLCVLGVSGCGFTEATIATFFAESGATIGIGVCADADGQGCSDTFGCPLDDCDLVCGLNFDCVDPDIAYDQCTAAAALGGRTNDGDLLIFDPSVAENDAGCAVFIMSVEDDAAAFDFGEVAGNLDVQLNGGDASVIIDDVDQIDDETAVVTLTVCQQDGDPAESTAIAIEESGRRSNAVCLFNGFEPVDYNP